MENISSAHAWTVAHTTFVIITCAKNLALTLRWRVGLSTWKTGVPLTAESLLKGDYERDLFQHLVSHMSPQGYRGTGEDLREVMLQWDINAVQGRSTLLHPLHLCENTVFHGIHPYPNERNRALYVPSQGAFAIIPVLPNNPFHMHTYGIPKEVAVAALEHIDSMK